MTETNKKKLYRCVGVGHLAFIMQERYGLKLVGVCGDVHSLEQWCNLCNTKIRYENPNDQAENLYWNYGIRLEKIKK